MGPLSDFAVPFYIDESNRLRQDGIVEREVSKKLKEGSATVSPLTERDL